MRSGTERVLNELQTLVHELEASFKELCAAEGFTEASESLKEGLARTQEKLEELESTLRREVQRGVKATDAYVRSNPWRSMGIAAAVALIVGALISRRGSD